MTAQHVVDVEQGVDHPVIRTPRLVMRPWSTADAEAAISIYGQDDVARWLSPAMDRVTDVEEMRALLQSWIDEQHEVPQGRWAVELRADGRLVGGVAVLPLPPEGEDLEIAWQLAPEAWGLGLATEAGHAVAHHAFHSGVEELFAVVRTQNGRGAATAQRVGMEWVGETEKYYDLQLQVYRVRKGELDVPSVPEQRRLSSAG